MGPILKLSNTLQILSFGMENEMKDLVEAYRTAMAADTAAEKALSEYRMSPGFLDPRTIWTLKATVEAAKEAKREAGDVLDRFYEGEGTRT
jgi:hypothetical protein